MAICAAVWLDHKEARLLNVHHGAVGEMTLAAPAVFHRHQSKGVNGGDEHPDDVKRFFHQVAKALDFAEQVLVVGPSTAKLEFIRYIHKNDTRLEPKIVGVETVDHPTDGQLMAYAKTYFNVVDRVQ